MGITQKQLTEAVRSAFDTDGLDELLRFDLDKDLADIVGVNENFRKITREVVAAAWREGWQEPLLRSATERAQNNPNLKLLSGRIDEGFAPAFSIFPLQQATRFGSWGVGAVLVAIVLYSAFLLRGEIGLTPQEITPESSLTLPAAPLPEVTATKIDLADSCPAPRPLPASADLDHCMVQIPAGVFTFGVPSDPYTNDLPQFYFDRFEVTNVQYQAYLVSQLEKDIEIDPPGEWINGQYESGEGFKPVKAVSWPEAQAYCEWVGKSLPTEAQWEKACRENSERLLPWLDEGRPTLPVPANVIENSCGGSLVVGSYLEQGPFAYDMADMLGNVGEWTTTIHATYPYDSSDGRENLENQSAPRVIRGGSYDFELLSCADRMASPPNHRIGDIGFRCVSQIPPDAELCRVPPNNQGGTDE